MKKIILNLAVDENNLKKDDIIIFQNGKWTNINKSIFLKEKDKEIQELKAQIKELKDKQKSMLEKINQKLKDYHDILQNLTNKGEL